MILTAAEKAALMLAAVLREVSLVLARVGAVFLTAIVLLAVSAAHGLTVALSIGARSVLSAIGGGAGLTGAGGLVVTALRLAVARLAMGLRRLIATLGLAVLLALLGGGLLAVALRLVAVSGFVVVVTGAEALTARPLIVVCHLCSSVWRGGLPLCVGQRGLGGSVPE